MISKTRVIETTDAEECTASTTPDAIERAFGRCGPVPIPDLIRGIGPAYWFRKGAEWGLSQGPAASAAPDFYERISIARQKKPHERLGQLICNALLPSAGADSAPLYYAQDATLVEALEAYASGHVVAPHSVDTGVIRAAEGVVLEPGEYEAGIPGELFSFTVEPGDVSHAFMSDGKTYRFYIPSHSYFASAVRRVEQQPPQPAAAPTFTRDDLIAADCGAFIPTQPSRIIRSGDLEMGKLYRVRETAELAKERDEALAKVAEHVTANEALMASNRSLAVKCQTPDRLREEERDAALASLALKAQLHAETIA